LYAIQSSVIAPEGGVASAPVRRRSPHRQLVEDSEAFARDLPIVSLDICDESEFQQIFNSPVDHVGLFKFSQDMDRIHQSGVSLYSRLACCQQQQVVT